MDVTEYRKIACQVIKDLNRLQLVKCNIENKTIESTAHGMSLSQNCIKYNTASIIDLRASVDQNMKDVMMSVCAASEFEEMKSKFDERKMLNALKCHEKMK